MKRLAVVIALAAALTGLTFTTPPAHAATTYTGLRVLASAGTQTGCWYHYGAAGPCSRGFDCSGLVFYAASRLGISLPRTTYGLLADSRQFYRVPVSSARPGDLMLYGSGHVEVMTAHYHTTFGAQDTGTRVGWHRWSAYWHPTIALRWR